MKGKIILGVVVALVVGFGVLVTNEVLTQARSAKLYAGDRIDLAIVNNQMRFYERDEGLLVVDYRGTIDVDDIDVRGLYETVKQKKLEIGDGYVFVPTYVDRESPVRVYVSDLMFRAMGGPEGSMDTSPNPAFAGPGDD